MCRKPTVNFLLFIGFLIQSARLIGQEPTVQDCLGAIPICQNIYIESSPYQYRGEGNYPGEIQDPSDTVTCITEEGSGVWYVFTAQSDGFLRFVITPEVIEDDYDWTVFDMTNGSCEDLQVDPAPYIVSTNTYGSVFGDNTTGANSDYSGGNAGNCNGPYEDNGPPWNDDIEVFEGHTYLIYVSNYMGVIYPDIELNGYTIDFSMSDVEIADNLHPHLEEISGYPSCGANSLKVKLSERVKCSSVSASDFVVSGPDGYYAITNVYSETCQAGAGYANEFTIETREDFQVAEYKVYLSGTVYDACNNYSVYSYLDMIVEGIEITEIIKKSPSTCAGDANGWIMIMASSVNGKHLYSIDGGKTYENNNGYFEDLPAGIYQIVVKNQFGCIKEGEDVKLEGPSDINISNVQVKDVTSCSTFENGAITIFANGGTGTLNYSIDGGITYLKNDGYFRSLGAGTYQIAVKDANNCIEFYPDITIDAPQPIILDIETTDVTGCYGQKKGSITIDAENGQGPYKYSIDNGESFSGNNQFRNLSAGTYNIVVEDIYKCTASQTVVIDQPGALKISTYSYSDSVRCYGQDNGFIRIYAEGGTGPLLYSIDGGTDWFHLGIFNHVRPGEYLIKVKDTLGCTVTGDRITIYQPEKLIIDDIIVGDVNTCYGDNTGSIGIIASGGTPPLSYSNDGGKFFQQDNTFENLYSGWYEVIVQDKNKCRSKTDDVKIDNAPKILVDSIITKDIECYGDWSGEIKIYARRGNPPYSYSIDGGNTYQSDNTFHHLDKGNYDVYIKDSKGCSVFAETVEIQSPPALYISGHEIIKTPTCHGDSDAQVQLHVVGDARWTWYALNDEVKFKANGGLFENLSAGTYVPKMKDTKGCIYYGDTIRISDPPKLSLYLESLNQVSCFSNNDGTIKLRANGGIPPYEFYLNNQTITSFGQATFDSLSAGNYQPAVRDANGCFRELEALTIIEPPEMKIHSLDYKKNLVCPYDTDGYINISVSGGHGGYMYALNDTGKFVQNDGHFKRLGRGAYVVFIKDIGGCVIQSDTIRISAPESITIELKDIQHNLCHQEAIGHFSVQASGGYNNFRYYLSETPDSANQTGFFSGLKASEYNVVARDSKGCIQTKKITILQPAPLSYNLENSGNITCFGYDDGEIRLKATGGVGGYQYMLSGEGHYSKSNGIFTDLPPGEYIPAVQDTNDCKIIGEKISINEPEKLTIESLTIQDVESCHGDSTGKFSVISAGGTGTHTYSIDSVHFYDNHGQFINISAGQYSLTIKDDNNCSAQSDFTITEPDRVAIDAITKKDVSCYAGKDGRINVSAFGGTGLLSISINNGTSFSNNHIFTNLKNGNYIVMARDINGCLSEQDTIFINQPEQLKLEISEYFNPSCSGFSDGYIQLSSKGGIPPYFYTINNGENFRKENGLFSNLEENTYLVFSKDSNNCLSEKDTVYLQEPPVLRLDSIWKQDVNTCFGDSTGRISTLPGGGTPPYSVSFNQQDVFFQGTEIRNLPAGEYEVFIKDKNNCLLNIDTTLIITQPEQIKITKLEKSDMTCNGLENGTISIDASGGTGELTFSVDTVSGFYSQKSFERLKKGDYVVFVKDSHNCIVKSAPVTIIEPDSLSIELINLQHVSCYGFHDGYINIAVKNPYGLDYQTEWSNNSTETSLYELGADLYTVLVTDINTNICAYRQYEIEEPPPLEMRLSANDASCEWEHDGEVDTTITGGTPFYVLDVQNSEGENIYYLDELSPDTYFFYLTDANGCSVNDTALVSFTGLDCIPELRIPNIFTPDGNNLNDFFTIETHHIEKYTMQIFTRWGRKIYENIWRDGKDSKSGWDGKINKNNTLAPPGVYYYIIDAKMKDGTHQIFKDFFHVYH
jgi:large repetitive protein